MSLEQILPVNMDELGPFQAYSEYLDKVPATVFNHLKNGNMWQWQADESMFKQFQWTSDETRIVLIGTVLLLLGRWILTTIVFRPMTRYLRLDMVNASRFPDSAWKVCYYLPAWLCTYHLLFRTGRHPYMTDFSTAWQDIHPAMRVPTDLYMVYMINLSFYCASAVTSLLFDRKKSDFYVMFTHHVLTNGLLAFSYVFRFHRIGLAVLYVHDLPDFLLDLAKLFNYCKKRGGKSYPVYGWLADATFFIFLGSWVYCRFYLFVTRVLYSTGYVAQMAVKDSTVFIMFNAVLHVLLAMHVYWFTLALNVLVKVAKGAELDDCRDAELMKEYRPMNGSTTSSPTVRPLGSPQRRAKKAD